MKKAPKETTSPTTKATRANTAAFAARSMRRSGTAARLARIVPVPYSALMASTPRIPMANWPKSKPVRLRFVGSNDR